MPEINKIIEARTGADLKQWTNRAWEFLSTPERRRVMVTKLSAFLKTLAASKEAARAMKVERTTEDPSGLQMYRLNNKDEIGGKHSGGLAILPSSASVEEIILSEKKIFGADLCRTLAEAHPGKFNLVTSPPLYDTLLNKPLLGLARDGRIIFPFQNNQSGSPTHQWENGGVILKNGSLEIVTFARLQEEYPNCPLAEQVMFTAERSNWQEIAAIPAYTNKRPLSPYLVGYFLKNGGVKRYFTLVPYHGLIGSVPKFLSAIERIGKMEGYRDWKAACFDVGGGFSGMVTKDENGEFNKTGPSKFRKSFWDVGHKRDRFYVFSWPESNQPISN